MRSIFQGQRTALRVMEDTCLVTRPTPARSESIDPATGALVAGPAPALIYSGRCGVFTPSGRDASQGDEPVERYDARVFLPALATEPLEGDTLEITAVGPTADASLIGRTYVVSEVERLSFQVARILHCLTLAPTERHL